MADTIAVLAAPGKLVAQGTPVSLKSQLGHGYTIDVAFNISSPQDEKLNTHPSTKLLDHIQKTAPHTNISSSKVQSGGDFDIDFEVRDPNDKVLLVPYEARHVPKYHRWMSSPESQDFVPIERITVLLYFIHVFHYNLRT